MKIFENHFPDRSLKGKNVRDDKFKNDELFTEVSQDYVSNLNSSQRREQTKKNICERIKELPRRIRMKGKKDALFLRKKNV